MHCLRHAWRQHAVVTACGGAASRWRLGVRPDHAAGLCDAASSSSGSDNRAGSATGGGASDLNDHAEKVVLSKLLGHYRVLVPSREAAAQLMDDLIVWKRGGNPLQDKPLVRPAKPSAMPGAHK
eukprot:jgi/Chlat1/3833/Chrsp26S04061